jgi:hypothetical protein
VVNGRNALTSRLQIVAAFVGILAGLCIAEDVAQGQDLRGFAKAHAAEKPGAALHLTGAPGEYSPKDIERLAGESDVVLRARLVRGEAYLGPNEDRVLTDYRIQVEQLVAGTLPLATQKAPGTTPPLTLTVYGGDVTVEGVLIRATDPNRHEIVDGRPYLLFLKHSRRGEPGFYEVHYGGIFDVSDNRVTPLLKQGGSIFKDTVGVALEDLIGKVKTAGGKVR